MRYKLFFLIFLILPLTVWAAEETYTLQSDIVEQAGLGIEFWNIDGDKITAFSLPLTLIYPYDDKTRFYATTSPARSSYNADGNNSLNGLSDIKFGGHHLMFDDQLLFTFGVNLPFGKNRLEPEEYAVAAKISLPALGFRTPILGQGLDVQLGLNSARPMGGYTLGYGLSFMHKGAFEPLQWYVRDYDPGNELTGIVGIQKKDVRFLGKRMNVRSDLLYTYYFTDYWGQEKAYKSGNRVLLQVLSAFKMRNRSTKLFIKARLKGKNKRGTGDIFKEESKNSNNTQFQVRVDHYLKEAMPLRYKSIIDVKYFLNNEQDIGGALLFGAGAGWNYQYTNRMSFNADARLYFGNLKSTDGSLSAFGISLYGGIVYTL